MFLAFSIDGGQISPIKIMVILHFIPSPNVFLDDYTNITAHAGIIETLSGQKITQRPVEHLDIRFY